MAGVRQFDEGVALDKALGLFWQKGLAHTTMQDLAEATGVQRGSLYNAYGDKETLFMRVFGVYRERQLELMRETLAAPDLRTALTRFLDFTIGTITSGSPSRGCFSTKAVVGIEDLDPEIRAAVRDLIDRIQDLLIERFSQPDAKGQLRLAPRDAAQMIVTMTRGLVVIERAYRDEGRLRETAASLVSLLLG